MRRAGRNAAHLSCQLEGEAAVELREGGGEVEAGERLPHAVARADAEGDEALRLPPGHLRHVLGVLCSLLQRAFAE